MKDPPPDPIELFPPTRGDRIVDAVLPFVVPLVVVVLFSLVIVVGWR